MTAAISRILSFDTFSPVDSMSNTTRGRDSCRGPVWGMMMQVCWKAGGQMHQAGETGCWKAERRREGSWCVVGCTPGRLQSLQPKTPCNSSSPIILDTVVCCMRQTRASPSGNSSCSSWWRAHRTMLLVLQPRTTPAPNSSSACFLLFILAPQCCVVLVCRKSKETEI